MADSGRASDTHRDPASEEPATLRGHAGDGHPEVDIPEEEQRQAGAGRHVEGVAGPLPHVPGHPGRTVCVALMLSGT